MTWWSDKRLLQEILTVLKRIDDKLPPLPSVPRTASIQILFSGESLMNSLSLEVGQSSIGTVVPLEADGVTPTPGAVVSAQSWSILDPSLSATVNPDGTITIAGVAVSTAPVTGTVSATVTDADGTVQNFSQSFTVTVVAAPPPPARTASIGVSFSTPAAA